MQAVSDTLTTSNSQFEYAVCASAYVSDAATQAAHTPEAEEPVVAGAEAIEYVFDETTETVPLANDDNGNKATNKNTPARINR